MKTLSLIALSTGLLVQAQQPRNFPQPEPAKPVTIAEIPGIIAAGSQWKMAWQGTATADGMAGTKDGGILFAEEQTNTIFKLDKDDKVSAFLTNPHGPG